MYKNDQITFKRGRILLLRILMYIKNIDYIFLCECKRINFRFFDAKTIWSNEIDARSKAMQEFADNYAIVEQILRHQTYIIKRKSSDFSRKTAKFNSDSIAFVSGFRFEA